MSFLVGDAEGALRTIVVGVLAYIALVAIVRVSGKRTLSKMNAFDLIVTVALGSTLATILLNKDVPLSEGVIAFLVLVVMQLLITASSVRWNRVARLAKSEPRALLYRGRVLRDALDDERVLDEELQAAIRGNGFGSYDEVDLVVLETDGSFSVVGRLPEGATEILEYVAGLGGGDQDRGGFGASDVEGGRGTGEAAEGAPEARSETEVGTGRR